MVIPGILFCRFLDTKAANPRVTSLLISERLLVAAEIMGEREEEAESRPTRTVEMLRAPLWPFL